MINEDQARIIIDTAVSAALRAQRLDFDAKIAQLYAVIANINVESKVKEIEEIEICASEEINFSGDESSSPYTDRWIGERRIIVIDSDIEKPLVLNPNEGVTIKTVDAEGIQFKLFPVELAGVANKVNCFVGVVSRQITNTLDDNYHSDVATTHSDKQYNSKKNTFWSTILAFDKRIHKNKY